jgi:hypothetical protein
VRDAAPRKDHRGVDPIFDVTALRPANDRFSIIPPPFRSRSHPAVIRVYDDAGKVIETHELKGGFKEP